MPLPSTSPKNGKKIAIVTMGVKLANETRGYTRFRFLAEFLVGKGYNVDLITTRTSTSSPRASSTGIRRIAMLMTRPKAGCGVSLTS